MTSRLLVMEDAAPRGCHRLSEGLGLMIRLETPPGLAQRARHCLEG